MSRLHDALEEALQERGIAVEPQMLRYAADTAQVLIRSRGLGLGKSELNALDRLLELRTGLASAVRRVLVEVVREPRFRSELPPDEIRAFGARFGRGAAARLLEEQQREVDLEAFGRAYGAEAGLELLEALFQLAGADGRIEEPEARGLEAAAAQLGVDGVLLSALFQRYDPRHAEGALRWPLTSDRLTIGRAASNDVILPDPQVARHHCSILRAGGQWRVVDAGSGRPVLLDGKVVGSGPIPEGSTVRVGPWQLRIEDEQLVARGTRSFTALTVDGLTREIDGVSLLEDVDFSVFEGELIALVGPSGAGKTTLINAISGIAPADSGSVELGGEDFHRMLEADPSVVGLVPQDDLVHPELTVAESLRYSGRLRTGDSRDVEPAVERVLEELGIGHIRDSRIGDALKRGISGGQRKRANLGQELLTDSTRVLFLDEPTSGLDPRSAQDIVRLVRQLADKGRIIFLVTHDLSPAIMAQVDHLLVMVRGGRVGYFGPPSEACKFFGVPSPDLIFDRLESRSGEAWAAEWRESQDCRKYVSTRQHLLERETALRKTKATAVRRPASPLRQLSILSQRYARTKLRDRAGLAVLMVQPPVLALLIWLVFPVPTTSLIFMLSLSCLWFGMSMAVRELIIDRTIWRRERKVGVGVLPYLGSKLGVLAALNAVQCLFFTSIVYFSMGLGDYGFSIATLGGAQILTGFTGLCLGLMLSALYTSSEAAVGTLPLLLIPNICFSSVMVSLRDMTALPKGITWVTMERFAFDLSLKMGTHLEEVSRIPGKWDRKPITGPLYDLGLKGADVDDMGLSVNELIGALGGFAGAFLLVSLVATWWRDRPKGASTRTIVPKKKS